MAHYSDVLNALMKLRNALEEAKRTNDGAFGVPSSYCLYDIINEAIDIEAKKVAAR